MSQRRSSPSESTALRDRLNRHDVTALVLAQIPVSLLMRDQLGVATIVALAVAAVAMGMLLIRAEGLHLARVSASRLEELRRLFRVAVLLAVMRWAVVAWLDRAEHWRVLLVDAGVVWASLTWFRGAFRTWLGAERAAQRHLRDVIVVGANADAVELVQLLHEYPEAGFRVCGVVGDDVHPDLRSRYVGPVDAVRSQLARLDSNGVIIVGGAVPAATISVLADSLADDGIHVQLSNGLFGLGHQRFTATPVAFQSLYYLEPTHEMEGEMTVKRAVDVVLATVGLVIAAPFMAVFAAQRLVRRDGPVLTTRVRLDRSGRPFELLRLRTSLPLGGCPQLINVLKGQMSLVGPQPVDPSATPGRQAVVPRMRPGITGLWRVECRSQAPSPAQARLDRYYVDNWSVTLDVVVFVTSIEQLVRRLTGRLHRAPAVPAVLLGDR